MSSKPEPVIWSHVTGQQIPCFDSCQLTITWIFSTIYVRLDQAAWLGFRWSMAAMFHWVAIVGCMCTRSTPLTMLAMKKELHRFLFLHMHVVVSIVMGLWFSTANRALLENNNIPARLQGFQVKLENFWSFPLSQYPISNRSLESWLSQRPRILKWNSP